jgi:mannose-6-phosphate isomerase-like protein (cupin superfamily)
MKIAKDFKLDGEIVKSDDRYVVKDSSVLTNLIVSDTELNPGKCTTGHSHAGQEEVYIFVQGHGIIQIDDDFFEANVGDMFAIPDGAFHKVFNESDSLLKFTAIFDGTRKF